MNAAIEYGGVNIDNLKALSQELYTPDSIAAYGVGSRFNGYYKPNSDVDIIVVTRKTRGLHDMNRDGFPGPVGYTYLPEETLNTFYAKRHSGLPMRVVPLANEQYVTKLAFDTKTELVKRVASRYQQQAGDGTSVRIPLLLPVAEHLVDFSRIEWRYTPKYLRALTSSATADILREEYRPVFDRLAGQGFFTKYGEDDYRVNPREIVRDSKLREGSFRMMIELAKAARFGLALPTIDFRIAWYIGKEAVKVFPRRKVLKKQLADIAKMYEPGIE